MSVAVDAGAGPLERLAASELERYLSRLFGPEVLNEVSPTIAVGPASSLGVDVPAVPGAYSICRTTPDRLTVAGHDEVGTLYGVYRLLEEYGVRYYLHGDVLPSWADSVRPAFSLPDLNLAEHPDFAIRGTLPWFDFLCGPTAWNWEDYKAYIDQMVKLRLNFLGFHVYAGGNVTRAGGAEPFLQFSYNGVTHAVALDTTATNRWGALPVRTRDFAFGTDRFFPNPVFGADEVINSPDQATAAKELLRRAMEYAQSRGIKVCIGFEPGVVPEEILAAVPEEATLRIRDGKEKVINPRSRAAREIIERRLDDLLTAYPTVDYVWLWQTEDAAWTYWNSESQPFDATLLLHAHAYLKTRAPGVRMVVSGWGAVHGLFPELHQLLPRDVIFSGLSHWLGWAPVSDVYARLTAEGRDCWPIPWLEDDANTYHPQLFVHRFHRDVSRARQFGCQGLVGIHWRTRIIDQNAAYMAASLWRPDLDPVAFYADYAAALAGGPHPDLAAFFLVHDWDQTLFGSLESEENVSSGKWVPGHSNEAWGGPYPRELPPDKVEAHRAYAEAFVRWAGAAKTEGRSDAADRLRWWSDNLWFTYHFARSQQLAHELDEWLKDPAAAHANASQVRHVLAQLESSVQNAVQTFAATVSNRGELGVLCSLNQRYFPRFCLIRAARVAEVLESQPEPPR